LADHLTLLWIDFQWWMPIVVGAIAIYVAWLWGAGRLSETPPCERVRPPKNEHRTSDNIP
jgi:hypothetical protein